MREDVKKAWIEELRKPGLKQTHGRLCRVKEQPGGYPGGSARPAPVGECCLGVLGRVLSEKFPDLIDGYHWEERNDLKVLVNPHGELSATGALPERVWDRLESREGQDTFYHMNDSEGRTFFEIAQFIEENE